MRNMQTRKTQIGPDDAGLNSMLTAARLDERRGRADVMASRLDNLADHIANGKLTSAEAAELLRDEAVKIVNEAQELH
ncbi:DUF2732 domain-containing protein [Cronobacter turicensis]|uniref:DUF2732 family protein n=1 Tax=Franconibacter daqui TaxID=2047724 RepID=UPI001D4E5627|nr:DUF2732 domain-containing protein [Cronobacter sakazakii]EGT4327043.1 DUF2732 domain-containing protein [Cronobacter sakazakii]EGT4364621.1 DUF2732 domain-containing protein [Cronobacter sakazakii]EKY3119579.1 DUF2732 domain-containing protein [Cronobacter turicensis]ELY4112494.1 DUF2732 domain-containing protein [Cronobacter turicensis]